MKKLLAISLNAAILITIGGLSFTQASVVGFKQADAATLVINLNEDGNMSETDSNLIQEIGLLSERPDKEFFLYSPEKFQDEFCLAQNIYFEAGIDNKAGMFAVGDVTLNRVADRRYPDSVCGVVYDGLQHANGQMKRNKCQFSWYCDGKSDNVPEGHENWVRAQMVAWDIIHNDVHRGITEGATHYHATYVSPRWRKDRGMELIGRIGLHIFYRWD